MRSSLRVVLSASLLSLAVAGCGGSKNEKFDYRTPGASAPKSTLDVPPDLISPTRDDRYAVPATASGMAAAQAAGKTPGAAVAVSAPANKFRIERFGNQRWLVTAVSADVLWPQLREYWKDLGFVLVKDDPVLGIMETEWAENHAKIAGDPIQRTLSIVLGSMLSNGERDRYRTRIEPSSKPGMIEIYVSHRGAEEVRNTDRLDGTHWELRPANPELEAEMLQRIAIRLGQDEVQAKQMVVESKAPLAERAKLVAAAEGGQQLVLQDGLDRGWRQVGLALDRSGVVVEDRDRAKGFYFVRYVAGEDLEGPKKDSGWFSGWFSSKKPAGTDQYRVAVSASGEQTVVQLQDKDGNKASAESTRQILNLLLNELK